MQQFNPSNEEINLSAYLSQIAAFGKKGLSFFKRIALQLFRNVHFILLFIIIGSGLAYSLRFIVPQYYQTDGIFVSRVLPASYCSMMIGNINDLIGSGNTQAASHHLQLKEEVIKKIRSVELLPIDEKFSHGERDSSISAFRIQLTASDMRNLEAIQNGVLSYLENSSYARIRKDAHTKSLLSQKTKLEQKLFNLDSLRTIITGSIVPRSEGTGIILGEPVDPVSVYNADHHYYEKLLMVEEDLSSNMNIETIQPFLQRNHYNYPDMNFILKIGIIISAIAGIVFILFFKK